MNTVEFPAARLARELCSEGRHALCTDRRVFGALQSENAVAVNEEWDTHYQGSTPRSVLRQLREDAALTAIEERVEDAWFAREEQACAAELERQQGTGFAAHNAGVMTRLSPVLPAVPRDVMIQL